MNSIEVHKIYRAVEVKPLDNMRILITFDNGRRKEYDCHMLAENKLFARLKEEDFFETVHIDDMGLVCWDVATDIDPYELYENAVDKKDDQ